MVSLTNFRSLGELTTASSQDRNEDDAVSDELAVVDQADGEDSETMRNKSANKCYLQHQNLPFHGEQRAEKRERIARVKAEASASKMMNNNKHHEEKDDTKKQSDPFEIRWTNLSYQVEPKWYQRQISSLLRSANRSPSASVSNGKRPKQEPNKSTTILENLSGCVKSGQVTAILGPSGAGKTSLLGCLTGRNKTGVSGCVQVVTSRQEPMSICTIPQKDFLLGQLTVRENLWFASRLKNPQDGFDHDFNIDRILDLLKLQSCLDTKISKISGGQHKRVSIAQELLSNPDILILDEPTSGLDSLTCYKTVMVLRDLAQLAPNPMAIIVTIHQPQREVFDLFNWVYILAKDGRCIYEGPPSNSIATINGHSGGHLQFDECQYSPASFLIEIASSEFGQKPIEALVEHHASEFQLRIGQDDNQLQFQAPNDANWTLSTPSTLLMRLPLLKSALFASSKQSSQTGSCIAVPIIETSPLNSNTTMQAADTKVRNNCRSPPIQTYAYSNEAFAAESSALAPNAGNDSSNAMTSQQQDQPTQANTSSNKDGEDDSNHRLSVAATDSVCGTTSSNQSSVSVELSSVPSSAPSSAIFSQRTLSSSGNFYIDQRLQTHKHNHKGHFYRHCSLLTKRSWLCLCKDPMLTTLRFTAHILVPLLITLVYGSRVGKANACPLYESELDLIDFARRGTHRFVELQDELRTSFENVGLYFLSIYAFTFSTMCLTSLSFPLSMHVLLKEVRNGWYSIPTYFIGKSLADFPLEFILPVVTLSITYPLTGQPPSLYQWRFIVGTLVFVITSLIAQTQGLIFGALFMNAMQAAVFVAPVSTTPLILLSGFLIRINKMPIYLQHLSSLSYFRYAIESLTILRYGFNQCPCDPALVTGEPVSAVGIPEQLRTLTNYWLGTFGDSPSANLDNNSYFKHDDDASLTTRLATTLLKNATTILSSNNGDATSITLTERTMQPQADFFQDITVMLARANSFGVNITSCADFKPYQMIDFGLEDEKLYVWMAALVATLVVSKIVNYLVVKYSVKLRL